MTLSVTELYIHPVKSCKGILLETADIGKYGFELDRLWAVTTSEHKLITARTHPKLLLVKQSLETINGKVSVKLEYDNLSKPLLLDPLFKDTGNEVEFKVWDDLVFGHDCGEEAATWFSEILEEKGCRLLIKSSQPRIVSDLYLKRDGYADFKSETGFSDGFPLLIASEESLKELQSNLPTEIKDQVGMRNFRPNIVIRGCSRPFDEDNFGVIRIGDISLHCDKPCDRCTFPNISPETGMPHKTEPSKTLMKIRRSYPHIGQYKFFFGIHAIPLQQGGTISVGDVIEVVTNTEK